MSSGKIFLQLLSPYRMFTGTLDKAVDAMTWSYIDIAFTASTFIEKLDIALAPV